MTKTELINVIETQLMKSNITIEVNESDMTVDELLTLIKMAGLELAIINPEIVTIISKKQLCKLHERINSLKQLKTTK